MALVVGLVCLVLVSIPVLAFMSMRLTSNQFIRETEQSLIHQAAIYASLFGDALERQNAPLEGAVLSEDVAALWSKTWHPWPPQLNLRRSNVLPPLPDEDDAPPLSEGVPDVSPAYRAIAPDLLDRARTAAKTTLAGAYFLDHRGVNIRQDRRADFSFAPEVQDALAGRVGTALRNRGDTYNRHPLTSISRDTWYRVFVAYPVIREDRVVGVVYLSRTPSSFAKFVVNEQWALLAMLGVMLGTGALVGLLLWRLFTRPVKALSAQSQGIASGALQGATPLAHYGIRELAELGQSIMQMSKTLTDRSRQITTYTDHVTHELKSPVTAILGAAELLNSGEISPEAEAKLKGNIISEADRMTTLLNGLREMTRLRDAPTVGRGMLSAMVPEDVPLEIGVARDVEVPLLPEHGRIILHHLARNAVEHGATRLEVDFSGKRMRVEDNGRGIAAENVSKVLDPFFTTRREDGGTGLGLSIVAAVLQNYGAVLEVVPSEKGAVFEVRFGE